MNDATQSDSSGRGDWRTARRRAGVLTALIVLITLSWVAFGLQLATIGQIAMAVLGLLTLAIACAWMALAIPTRRPGGEPKLN